MVSARRSATSTPEPEPCKNLLWPGSVNPQNLALCDAKIGQDYNRLTADRPPCCSAVQPLLRPLPRGAILVTSPRNMRPKKCSRCFPALANAAIEFQLGVKIGITAQPFSPPQVGRPHSR